MTLEYSQNMREMAHEVLMNVRKHPYTPAQAAEIPNILAVKASYFFGNDLNDAELLKETYVAEGFKSFWNGAPGCTDPDSQIAQQMFVVNNEKMVPTHFGVNQVVWFMDDTHARLLTRMHDHHTYIADEATYSGYGIYVDDMVKGEDGIWRMETLRLDYAAIEGELRYD